MIELRFRFDAALRESVQHTMAVELNKPHDQERSDGQPTQRHTNRLLGYPDDARCAMPPTRR
jgi:hypothetical protein